MLLLDTNVVSELRKIDTHRADLRVTRWQSRIAAADLYISVVTLTELEIGILRLARRDVLQAAVLREWLQKRVLPEFASRMLVIDRAIALRCAQLHVPDPKPKFDAYIAATALVHGIPVVTRNVADFAGLGLTVINPWDEVPSAELQ